MVCSLLHSQISLAHSFTYCRQDLWEFSRQSKPGAVGEKWKVLGLFKHTATTKRLWNKMRIRYDEFLTWHCILHRLATHFSDVRRSHLQLHFTAKGNCTICIYVPARRASFLVYVEYMPMFVREFQTTYITSTKSAIPKRLLRISASWRRNVLPQSNTIIVNFPMSSNTY